MARRPLSYSAVPSAKFTYSVDDLTVTFTNNSVLASQWLWTFGDGVISTTQNPSHTYETYGYFTVRLTINSDDYHEEIIVVPNATFYMRNLLGSGAFTKLNNIEADESLDNLILDGDGVADTLLSGNVVTIDGENWIDGYASSGLLTIDLNPSTILSKFIFTNDSLLNSAATVFYITASGYNNQIYIRKNDSNFIEFRYGPFGGTVRVTSHALIVSKQYVGFISIGQIGTSVNFYLNGLLINSYVVDAEISTSTLNFFNEGAETSVGLYSLDGYHQLTQVIAVEQDYRTIREMSLKAMDENPLGFHNRYGVLGDGSAARLNAGKGGSLDNNFNGGGGIYLELIIYQYTSSGRVVNKRSGTGWTFNQISNTGDLIALELFYDYASVDGRWRTSEIIRLNEPFGILIELDSSSDSNNPTMTLIQSGVVTVLTVGDGITELATPSGAVQSDAAGDLIFLGDTVFTDGLLIQAALFGSIGTTISELGQDLSSLSPVAYWKMGDYLDASVHDYIDTNGNGIIYDATQETQLGNNIWDLGVGTYDTGIGAWNSGGTNTVTNDSGQVKCTYVDNSTALRINFNNAADLNSDLIVGQTYMFKFDCRVTGNGVHFEIDNGSGVYSAKITSFAQTQLTTVKLYFVAQHATNADFRMIGFGVGEEVWIDNASLTPVNGNPALPFSMNNNDLIETRPMQYLTYLSELDTYFDALLYGYGSRFRNYGTTNDYGTATTRGGENFQGLARIVFDGATSYVNCYSLLSGISLTVPTSFTMYFELGATDWTPASTVHIFQFYGNDNYSFSITLQPTLVVFTYKVNSVTYVISTSSSSLAGINRFVITTSPNEIKMYRNGIQVASNNTVAHSMDRNWNSSWTILGAGALTPSSVWGGDILLFGYTTSALTSTQISTIESLRDRPQ